MQPKQLTKFVFQNGFATYMIGVATLTPQQERDQRPEKLLDNMRFPDPKAVLIKSSDFTRGSWIGRDLWLRHDVMGDGVPWYVRQRVLVTVTKPTRILSAMALAGLPSCFGCSNEFEPADAFVEHIEVSE